jgi:hypothetical protein
VTESNLPKLRSEVHLDHRSRGGYVAADWRVWEVRTPEGLRGAECELREVMKNGVDLDR